ncbi:AMP-binding protein [soil metagenome]
MTGVPADLTNQPVVWRPRSAVADQSRAMQFASAHGITSSSQLARRAIDDPEWFWEAVCEELGIVWAHPYDRVLDLARGIEWPDWFPGGRMNYVTSAVDQHLVERAGSIALRWEGDDGAVRTLTFQELAIEVNRVANGLQSIGVTNGARVGIYLPMLIETAVALLACGKLGAEIVPIFSGFGADAAATRIADATVTHLITADGFRRRGRVIELKPVAERAAELAGCVERVVVVQHVGQDIPWNGSRDHWWTDLTANAPDQFEAVDTAADTPYMVIYTSGTTGRPKGAVHVHAGFPIKAAQDLAFPFDVRQDEVLCWLTDIGWMMGPWAIIGGLIAGASVLLYEGTPDYPEPDRLWSLVERHQVNVLGVSPTAIRALMGYGDDWVERHPMPSLRAIGSTGEPWNPGPWRWAHEIVARKRCPIVNYSGGTEISGGILVADANEPQKPAAFSGPVVGIDADVVDREGRPIRGEVGELVIRSPWVGMTSGFLNEPERYLETYWSQIPGLWVHGDWAYIDDDEFWYILGRSDDTMNIAGKRVGPAEIESAAVSHPAVQEAAAVGTPHPVKGEVATLFVILAPGQEGSPELEREILDAVAAHLGRPLRPEQAHFVTDLPRTRNAKIMRRVLRAHYLGDDSLGDLSALENPDVLESIARAD